MTSYVRYHPGVETIPDDEAETITKIIKSFETETDMVAGKEGHAMRPSHAKASGYATGELLVDELPEELAQGLFARPARHEVMVRWAQGPGEHLDDSVSTHRGMAIRVLGLGADVRRDADDPHIQDFVLATGDTFIRGTAKTFQLDFSAGLSKAPALPQVVKEAVSDAARIAEAGLEAIGVNSPTLDFYGHVKRHPLADNYFSQAPLRWGDHIAKVAATPSDATLAAIGDLEVDTDGRPDAFRDAVVALMLRHGAEFELRVQLCTDLDKMPVEDASKRWSQDESPYRTVARIVLPPQNAYGEARRRFFDEGVGFSPGYGLAAHRPLGGIMRARMATYPVLQAYRRRINGVDPILPKSLSEVPD